MIDVNLSSFYFVPSSAIEVETTISKLKNKGNPLFDMTPNILKAVSKSLSPLISEFYNNCFLSGLYPEILKEARVVPIFKSGNSNDVNNYRPISNLSTINKIFEKLTYFRLLSFINYNEILSRNQFGFRQNCNTTTAIFTLVTDILDTFNKKVFTIALFLDLKKAFDVVDFEILKYKLELYGIRGIAYYFLSSYIADRK